MIRNGHCPVDLHRVDLCHDVDGCGCDYGLGHLRLHRAGNYFDDLVRDRCPDCGLDRDLDCDHYCDLDRDHYFVRYFDQSRDPNQMYARLHDVRRVQLECLRVRLVRFPNRQEVHHLHQALLVLRLEQRSLQPLVMQALQQQVLALQALSVQESCQ